MAEPFSWIASEGVAVVTPPEELDLQNSDMLRVCCRDAIDGSSACVVVDLSKTRFMDSTALGVFVRVAKLAKAQGGWLRLVTGDSTAVQKVLRLTALDSRLGSYPDLESAIAAESPARRGPAWPGREVTS